MPSLRVCKREMPSLGSAFDCRVLALNEIEIIPSWCNSSLFVLAYKKLMGLFGHNTQVLVGMNARLAIKLSYYSQVIRR